MILVTRSGGRHVALHRLGKDPVPPDTAPDVVSGTAPLMAEGADEASSYEDRAFLGTRETAAPAGSLARLDRVA